MTPFATLFTSRPGATRHILTTAFAAICVALSGTSDAHSNCGPAPQNQAYSTQFYQAQARLFEQRFSQSSNGGLSVGVGGVSVGATGGHDSATEQTGYETLTISQAMQYVQQEHADAAAQIVDECAYRMCTFLESGASPVLVAQALAFQADICQAGIPFSGNGSQDFDGSGFLRILKTVPSVIPLQFTTDNSATAQVRRLHVINNTPDQATIKVEASIDYGSATTDTDRLAILKNGKPLRPGRTLRFTVKPGTSFPVDIQVLGPTGSSVLASGRVVFRQVGNSPVASITQFVMSRPIVQPPALPGFPATGLTTSYAAFDDGQVRAGAALSFTDNGDGTITDNNTGLMWEKKSSDGGLHDVAHSFVWLPGSGSIWEWLAQTNAENGVGFAGHDDWRIPNIKELLSIVNYQEDSPAVSPAFDSACTAGCSVGTCSCTAWQDASAGAYWSSTTLPSNPQGEGAAWTLTFLNGAIHTDLKLNVIDPPVHVRAVRGGLAH